MNFITENWLALIFCSPIIIVIISPLLIRFTWNTKFYRRYHGKCTSGDCKNGLGTFTFYDEKTFWDKKFLKDSRWSVRLMRDIYRIAHWSRSFFSSHLFGDKYEGEWKNGDYHKGKYTFGHIEFRGIMYKGEFKNNKYHGEGTYIWDNGESHSGKWKNGKLYSGTYINSIFTEEEVGKLYAHYYDGSKGIRKIGDYIYRIPFWHRSIPIETGKFISSEPYNGLKKVYAYSDIVEAEFNYKNGKKDGLFKEYYCPPYCNAEHVGKLKREGNFNDGKLISSKCWDEEGNEIDCE